MTTAAMSLRCTLLLALALCAHAAHKNVLYLIADDFRPEMNVAYGQTHVKTPNFDKLAAAALTFDNAYCQQAVCGPSRNSFMTGRSPDVTGISINPKGGVSFRSACRAGSNCSEWITMPEHFKLAGYQTFGGGKTFHPGSPKNWDEPTSWTPNATVDEGYFPFSYFIQPNKSWPVKEREPKLQPCHGSQPSGDHGATGHECSKIDTFCTLGDADSMFYDSNLADHMVKLLTDYAKSPMAAPFFVMAGFARPHAPWRVPARFMELYPEGSVPMPQHRLAPTGMPPIAYHRQGIYLVDGSVHVATPTKALNDSVTEDWRRHYYGAVSWFDFQVGRLLDTLASTKLESSTIVVVHGDHGWQLGEHDSWHKQTNFELGARVPLLIKVPWLSASSGGKHTTSMAELLDLYPTLAALTATAPAQAAELDGKSLAPLFTNPAGRPDSGAKHPIEDGSAAYSQYIRCHNLSLPAYDNDVECQPASAQRSDAAHNQLTIMGYSIRVRDWRYTSWLHWDARAQCAVWYDGDQTGSNVTAIYARELYNHTGDDGTDFDAFENENLAAVPTNAPLMQELQDRLVMRFGKCLPCKDCKPPGPDPEAPCTAEQGFACKPRSYCVRANEPDEKGTTRYYKSSSLNVDHCASECSRDAHCACFDWAPEKLQAWDAVMHRWDAAPLVQANCRFMNVSASTGAATTHGSGENFASYIKAKQ